MYSQVWEIGDYRKPGTGQQQAREEVRRTVWRDILEDELGQMSGTAQEECRKGGARSCGLFWETNEVQTASGGGTLED